MASIGHVQDDESRLVYMRARYYEPGSGRFVSEDPAQCGLNFYLYGSGNPVSRVDRTGKYDESSANASYALLWIAVLGYVQASEYACGISNTAKFLHATCSAFLLAYFLPVGSGTGGTLGDQFDRANRVFVGALAMAVSVTSIKEVGITSIAGEAVGISTQYTAFPWVFMALDAFEDQVGA